MTDIAAAGPLEPSGATLGPGSSVAVAVAARATPAQWRLLVRKPTFLVGAAIVVFWIVCAIFGHAIAPDNPLAQQLLATNAGPSGAHWFGTDEIGRDVLSRVIVGARDILVITPLATILGTVAGTALGLAMGYLGGAFDLIAGRIVEAVLALPSFIIALLFIAAVGPSTVSLIARSARGSSRCATSLRRRSCSAPSLLSVVPRAMRLVSRLSATPLPDRKVASSRSAVLHSA